MVALFVTAAVSCSKDTEDLIIGTWEVTESTYTLIVNGEVQETISTLDPGDVYTCTYNKDHTYNYVLHSPFGDAEDSGTWSHDDSKLTITSNGNSYVYVIDHIDKKNMSLITNYYEAGEGGDVTVSIKMKRI